VSMLKTQIFQEMERRLTERYPAGIIPQDQLEEAIPSYKISYWRTLQARGMGPASFLIGRKRFYKITNLLEWLEERSNLKK